MSAPPIVLAITGASGSAYAVRLLELLVATDQPVALTISPAAQLVFQQELSLDLSLDNLSPSDLLANARPLLAALGCPEPPPPLSTPRIEYYHFQDFLSPIASGSARTRAMVICPCSGSTLGAVVHGTGGNLIHRAAEVHLKERRPLILVPRETPVSLGQLRNWQLAAEQGCVVLPAMPGFYHQPCTVGDLVDFVVARICDQLHIDLNLIPRWGQTEGVEQR